MSLITIRPIDANATALDPTITSAWRMRRQASLASAAGVSGTLGVGGQVISAVPSSLTALPGSASATDGENPGLQLVLQQSAALMMRVWTEGNAARRL